MQLFYTEDCDPNYQPVGFEPYSDDSLYFPSSNGWKRTSISFGKCDSGHHKVNLNLSYTLPDESWEKANAREQADRFKMPTIPENLVYGEEVSTEMDIDQSVVSMESPSQRETGNSRPSTLEMPPPPTQQSFEGAEYTQASAQVQSSQASKYPVPRLDDRIQLQGASPAPSYVPGSQGEIAPTQDTVGRIEVGLTKEVCLITILAAIRLQQAVASGRIHRRGWRYPRDGDGPVDRGSIGGAPTANAQHHR